jgi:hypothetical protein
MTGVIDWFRQYGKVIPLFVGGIVLAWRQVRDGGITGPEWNLLAAAVIGGFLAYWVPNLTGGLQRYTKAIAFAALAVSSVLPAYLPNGVTADELYDLLILFLTELGIIVFPSQQWLADQVVVGRLVARTETAPVQK